MGNVEVPDWLKGLPLAPVYRPTDTEFADPIAYISKIEKEASAFGICKILPPLPKPSKKYVFHNLNKSLLKCPELGSDVDFSKMGDATSASNAEIRAVFTTRQQELGQNVKRTKGENNESNLQWCVHKQVWQSGEIYTLEEFESKSKAFSRSQLGMIKNVSPAVVEALFWKAASEKPIYIEYANDVPGSAFGEPEGHFRHIRRRRRRRGQYQRNTESNERNERENQRNTCACLEPYCEDDRRACPEKEKASNSSPSLSLDESSRSFRQKSVNSADDMEGTAGWKLSNTQWNLQMIARSPGSITRFMPDDIPGVTSPMVYIGMLFSWFAWHVEDHELHSMNFLHTGSPKTWYAVPGDNAIDFEEIIRTKVYGGKIDRLAALTLLGEKTTLLSPEVVVTSGIPCYRLIQNPGEYVVTFPRAYHVGFSHGFNCGEAANFATPQWLKAAKEAAVRRAAMNYLPMLSHQQLLYLLTMSFVSRVPRSFLPGARSSRFRDRLREERELLVKKAFVHDMLDENETLSVLLDRELSYRLVLWDPDLLPRQNKESLTAAGFAPVTTGVSSTPVAEGEFQGCSETQNTEKKSTLLEELSMYMENMNKLYDEDDDDDLLNHFQVDSGTLACVACGVLGFPFMSVVQPSEKALKILDERQDDIGSPDAFLFRKAQEISTPSLEKFENRWNMSCRYSRPRIFCLEHTVQLQKLLHSRGGLNVLIICHKDFQKIKAHAKIVAEEVNIPFSFNDVPLGSASQEDLSLIDLAIEDEETNEHGEDWTSKLGFNLRYFVKVRKNSPTRQIQHALSLGGLFSDTSESPDFSNIKWKMRKLRSKAKRSHSSDSNLREQLEVKADGRLGHGLDSTTGRKEEKLIQYSRRKRFKPRSFGEQGPEVDLVAKSEKVNDAPDKHSSRSKRQLENSVAEANGQEFVGKISMTTDESCSASGEDMMNSSSENHVQLVNPVMQNGNEDESISRSVNCDGLRKSHAEYVCEDASLADTQQSPGTGILEYGKPTFTITNIDDGGLEQEAIELNNKEAVIDAHTRIEEEQAVCTLQVSSLTREASCTGEDLCSKNTSYAKERQNRHMHLSAQLGLEVPAGGYADEKSVVDVTGDDETKKNKQISTSSNGNHVSSSLNGNCLQTLDNDHSTWNPCNSSEVSLSQVDATSENTEAVRASKSDMETEKKKRKIEIPDFEAKDKKGTYASFIRGPCEGLRPRAKKESTCGESFDVDETSKDEKFTAKREKKPANAHLGHPQNHQEASTSHHRCNLEGCRMSFENKADLQMHKRNRCTHEGCGKKFRAHKYLLLHQRVHNDDRPFKCPWKGCLMSFKWQWARTEHMRLHTGERPYKCKVEGCGLSFRFVSDYSRHRRKTGHYVN